MEVERTIEPEPAPEGQLFPESQIETVAPQPKEKEKEKEKKHNESCFKLRFKKLGTKLNEAWGGLYDSIIEENANE